jgi:hypothetical protein
MLAKRMTIQEYTQRAMEECRPFVNTDCLSLVADYLRPGFLVSSDTLSDLYCIADILICDHKKTRNSHTNHSHLICECQYWRERAPMHFQKSRFKTSVFQEFLKDHDDWVNEIGPYFAQLWNQVPLISETRYVTFKSRGSSFTWCQSKGQTVQQLLFPLTCATWKAEYIAIGVDGLPWLELSEDPTPQNSIIWDVWDFQFNICSVCRKEITENWIYCSVCQSGPYCSSACQIKCSPEHKGFDATNHRDL